MAITNFIPELWSARLLRALETSLVYGQAAVINRDYEGQITQAGDTVHVNTIGAITIKDYDRTAPIADPEDLSTALTTLLVDQEKYFNFKVNDVDKAQAAGALMGPASQEAAYGLRKVADTHIAGLYAEAVTGGAYVSGLGSEASPVDLATAADAYDLLVDLSVGLDTNDVPDEGRWVVIPPWFAGLLAKDERLLRAQPDLVGNGAVGLVDRLRVYRSNQVPKNVQPPNDQYTIVAGHPIGWSYAEQIVSTEAYRVEKGFDDGVKGLHVYGAKVIRPTAFAVATVVGSPVDISS